MDARIERLIKRRDTDGYPLPLTPDEISLFSRKFGSDVAQAAVKEILAQREAAGDKAEKKAQADADRKLKSEQQATENAAKQAETDRLNKEAEAKKAREDTETTRLQKEQKHREDLEKTMDLYRKTWTGRGMAGAEALSPFLGIGAGYGLADRIIEPLQARAAAAKNTQRKALGDAFSAINPASPTAQMEYQSIADAAKTGSLVPGTGNAAIAGRGSRRYLPYGLGGLAMLGEGAFQRYLGSDPEKDPFIQDAWTGSGTANMGAGATLMVAGSKYADNPTVLPDSDALRKIDLAGRYAGDMSKVTPPIPPGPGTSPAGGSMPPKLKGTGIAPSKGTDQILESLGLGNLKGLKWRPKVDAIETAFARNPAAADAIAKAADYSSADLLLGALKRSRGMALPFAIGVGALGLASDEAHAAPRDEAWPDRPIDPLLRSINITPENFHHLLPWVQAADIGTAAGETAKAAMNRPEPSVIEKPKPRIDPRLLVPSLDTSGNVNEAKEGSQRRNEIGSEARTATPQSTAVQQALRAAGDVAGRAPAEAAYKSDVKAIEPEAAEPASTSKPQNESNLDDLKTHAYNWLTHQAHLKHQASLAGGEPYDDYEDRIKHLQAAGLA